MKRCLITVFLAVLTVPAYAAEPSLSNEAEAKALRLFRQNGIAMDNLKISQFIQYREGGGMVLCDQTYKGLPIFFAQVGYHFHANGKVMRTRKGQVFVGGNKKIDPKAINIDVNPTITRQEAVDIFVQRSARPAPGLTLNGRPTSPRPGIFIDPSTVEVVLGLFDLTTFGWNLKSPSYMLAWHATSARIPHAVISAKSGHVLWFDDGVRY
jgi:hypothetical protein